MKVFGRDAFWKIGKFVSVWGGIESMVLGGTVLSVVFIPVIAFYFVIFTVAVALPDTLARGCGLAHVQPNCSVLDEIVFVAPVKTALLFACLFLPYMFLLNFASNRKLLGTAALLSPFLASLVFAHTNLITYVVHHSAHTVATKWLAILTEPLRVHEYFSAPVLEHARSYDNAAWIAFLPLATVMFAFFLGAIAQLETQEKEEEFLKQVRKSFRSLMLGLLNLCAQVRFSWRFLMLLVVLCGIGFVFDAGAVVHFHGIAETWETLRDDGRQGLWRLFFVYHILSSDPAYQDAVTNYPLAIDLVWARATVGAMVGIAVGGLVIASQGELTWEKRLKLYLDDTRLDPEIDRADVKALSFGPSQFGNPMRVSPYSATHVDRAVTTDDLHHLSEMFPNLEELEIHRAVLIFDGPINRRYYEVNDLMMRLRSLSLVGCGLRTDDLWMLLSMLEISNSLKSLRLSASIPSGMDWEIVTFAKNSSQRQFETLSVLEGELRPETVTDLIEIGIQVELDRQKLS